MNFEDGSIKLKFILTNGKIHKDIFTIYQGECSSSIIHLHRTLSPYSSFLQAQSVVLIIRPWNSSSVPSSWSSLRLSCRHLPIFTFRQCWDSFPDTDQKQIPDLSQGWQFNASRPNVNKELGFLGNGNFMQIYSNTDAPDNFYSFSNICLRPWFSIIYIFLPLYMRSWLPPGVSPFFTLILEID